MNRPVAAALLLFSTAASATVNLQKRAQQMAGYVGGTIAYELSVVRTDLARETSLVLHDPTPPNHQLLTVEAGTSKVDCTQMAGGSLGNGIQVTCNVGGELQIAVPDNSANPPMIVVTYRVTAAGTSSNTVNVSCAAASCTNVRATAMTPLSVATLGIVKSGPATARPGESIEYTITVSNPGAADLSGWVIHDDLPSGFTFESIRLGGATFTAANLASAAMPPVNAQVTLAGSALDIRPPFIAAGASYPVVVRGTIAASAGGTTLSNTATATPPGGAAVSSGAVATAIARAPSTLSFSKQVVPERARPGDAVRYTLRAVPSAPQAGPITLTDPLDPSLRIDEVRVDGQVVACGATPVTAGRTTVSCGGGTLTVTVPAGGTLDTPLTVEIGATLLPTAAGSVVNQATLADPGGTQTASATVAVTAPTTGASLSFTAGRVLAEKDDLVPFVAAIAVPVTGLPLAAPTLTLSPSSGLRVGDVRITSADGTMRLVRPTETGNALAVQLGPLAAGATLTVTARARVGGRAHLGKESMRAQLSDGATLLDTKQAEVRIIADPEFDLGTLVGQVFRDDNGDGTRGPGERGIEGAVVVMDDGLQAVTDAEGRYHLAAIVPGDRAVKVAAHTLPPGTTFTTDETRIATVTPGSLVTINFGCRVPAPDPPPVRPAPPSDAPPELRPVPGGLAYRLVGQAVPRARVLVDGRPATVDKSGAWSLEVTLTPGRTRLTVVTAYPDGRVVVASRDVHWVERPAGGSLIIPRAEEPHLTLRFPPSALAEPTLLLEGTASSPLATLTVAGQPLTADGQGHFAVRLRVPESGAGIAVDARFRDGLHARFEHLLAGGADFVLLVGLAEGKIGYVQRDKNLGSSGFYAEGRVKLYAKGRIQGRWLLEGGLDIDSTAIDDWRDLFRGDPARVFRNLDPDRFYTVYGDASQTTQPANSRARLFVRIQLDRSELLLGNLQTGLTGVEFGRYARAVTGGRLSFVRAATDPDAPPSTQVIAFGAWLQTARAHDELRGTGGSLYYLSHRSVVEGSEQVRIELRDRISDRPTNNTAQRATVDYEVDYLAGRVMLRDPLSSIAASPTLIRSGTLDGDRAYLVVDYEYVVTGDVDDGTAGLRATQRIGPFRVGGTAVDEFRSHGSYTLLGGDLQIDLKKYGVILGEFAHSFGDLSSFSRSDDGGLTYHDAVGTSQAAPSQREGNAWKAEADLHFLNGGVSLRPYARGIDQGYTDTAHAGDASTLQWGVDAEASFWKLKLRLHYDERRYEVEQFDATGVRVRDVMNRGVSELETRRDIGGEIGGRFGRVGVRLGARTERADDSDATKTGHRTAVGARVDVDLTRRVTLYVAGQYAPEHDGPGLLGRDNSLAALGTILTLPWDTRATAEANYGVDGAGGLLSLRTALGPGRVLYGTFTLSQDRDDRLSSTVAAGGRERIADAHGNARATLYAEDQFRDGPLVADGGGRAHMLTTGLDLPLSKRFLFGATFERGEVTPSGPAITAGQQPLARTAGTLYASYGGDRLRAQVKGELRNDTLPGTPAAPSLMPAATPAVDELQWLASALVTLRPHKDLTLRAKAFFSRSAATSATLARSSEATVGFAWRPSFTDRFNLLGRYTYLDEGVTAGQAPGGAPFRERAHVMSLAAEGRVVWRFSLGEKIGAKRRDEPTEGTASWFVLWVNRVSLHVTRAWDAVVEYRLLYGPGPTLTNGVSLEVNRILVGHLRLGAGWNFADFSDDEQRLGRGSEQGFFLRAQGFY
jgi:uncharacterized repeat protein (TIGR01451 family)